MHPSPRHRRRSAKPRHRVLGSALALAVLVVSATLFLHFSADGSSRGRLATRIQDAVPQQVLDVTKPLSARDGYFPDGTTIEVEASVPALQRLDPDLRAALRSAADAAAHDGVHIEVASGWRSARYQRRLFDEASERYASTSVAQQFVATPEKSTHVTGRAVDVGPLDAELWLEQHGNRFGLCRTFANELWHFELATTADTPCPDMLPDASHQR